MRKFSKVIFASFTGILLSACSLSMASNITPPPGAELPAAQEATQAVEASLIYPLVPPDPGNGAAIYKTECSPCHGTRGLGDGPQAVQLAVPVASLGLSDFARLSTPAEWYSVVTNGNMEKLMPPFNNLTDRQRWDVIDYAMSLSVPASSIAQGNSLYKQYCSSCHGSTGRGDGPDGSTLAPPPTDFTNQAKMAITSGEQLYQAISAGVSPSMPAYSGSLSENNIWSLVSYLRSLTLAIPQPIADAYPSPMENAVAPTPYPGPQTNPSPAETQTAPIISTTDLTPTSTFTGTVTVELTNGSGGTPPSDALVTLYGFDNMQNTYTQTLSIGENGIYTFTNVTMPEGRAFLAGADYASGTYGSDVALVDPATANLTMAITVYDTTTDSSLLSTDRVHIFVDFSEANSLSVIEVFVISNPSNLAVISPTPGGAVVTFPLPAGYSNLQFQEGALGERYIPVEQGFADTNTVYPGVSEYTVVFAFQLPYDHKLDFIQPVSLPTSAAVLMVPDNGVKVTSSQFQNGGTQVLDSTDSSGNSVSATYRKFNSSSLIAGSSLEFTLSGNPKKSLGSYFSSGTMQSLAIGIGLFGVALVGAAVWLYQKNRRKLALQPAETLTVSSSTDMNATPEDEDTLMDAIIALDDQYHAGNLPEAAYLERRAALKEKLRQMEQG